MRKSSRSFTARDIAVIGLMIALKVVMTRFLTIETQFVRVSFTFIPTVLMALMYGPWVGGIAGALGDLIGFFLFSRGFPFHPGFTISAAVAAILYGLILYKKPLTLQRIIFACLTVTVLVNIGLNSLWLRILYDQAFWALLPVRLLQNAVTLPIDVALIYWITNNKPIQRVLKDYPILWKK